MMKLFFTGTDFCRNVEQVAISRLMRPRLVAGGGQLGAGLGLQLGLLLPRQGLAPGAALLLLGRLGQGPGVPGGLPLVVVVAAVHQHDHVHRAGA